MFNNNNNKKSAIIIRSISYDNFMNNQLGYIISIFMTEEFLSLSV